MIYKRIVRRDTFFWRFFHIYKAWGRLMNLLGAGTGSPVTDV